jgi:TetR/AcrR family transcriptional regulator, transcriptional repressor for nem operon
MARPRQFDRDVALDAALRVFLVQGYEATTTDDLRLAMGIGRQSFYDTFGDKHSLYLEALQRYNTRSIANFMQGLLKGDSSRTALEKALTSFAEDPQGELALGCMGINAVCEFGRADEQVSALIDASQVAFSKALRLVLGQGKANGEFAEALDETQAVNFLISTLAGMKVSARAGASTESLNHIARFAVRALCV